MSSKIKGIVSSAAILGSSNIKHIEKFAGKKTSDCIICSKPIPTERIKALKLLNVPHTNWTHTGCSTTSKIKGVYLGEVGTSQLQLCDKLYNDSVRSVFRKAEVDPQADDDSEEDSEN